MFNKKNLLPILCTLMLVNPIEAFANECEQSFSSELIQENQESVIDFQQQLEQIYPIFYQIHWDEYTNEERMQYVNILSSLFAEHYSVEKPNIIFDEKMPKEEHAKTYLDENTVVINSYHLDCAEYMFRAVVHEMNHVLQKQTDMSIFNNYISFSSDQNGYFSQKCEIDARTAEHEEYNKLLDFAYSGDFAESRYAFLYNR